MKSIGIVLAAACLALAGGGLASACAMDANGKLTTKKGDP